MSVEDAVAEKRAAEGYGGPLRGTLARYVRTVGCASTGACTFCPACTTSSALCA